MNSKGEKDKGMKRGEERREEEEWMKKSYLNLEL